MATAVGVKGLIMPEIV